MKLVISPPDTVKKLLRALMEPTYSPRPKSASVTWRLVGIPVASSSRPRIRPRTTESAPEAATLVKAKEKFTTTA